MNPLNWFRRRRRYRKIKPGQTVRIYAIDGKLVRQIVKRRTKSEWTEADELALQKSSARFEAIQKHMARLTTELKCIDLIKRR